MGVALLAGTWKCMGKVSTSRRPFSMQGIDGKPAAALAGRKGPASSALDPMPPRPLHVWQHTQLLQHALLALHFKLCTIARPSLHISMAFGIPLAETGRSQMRGIQAPDLMRFFDRMCASCSSVMAPCAGSWASSSSSALSLSADELASGDLPFCLWASILSLRMPVTLPNHL